MTRELWAVSRGLLRTPGFAVLAVVTLALGIGANTAVFGLFDALVLRPLPFEDADRLTRVALDLTEREGSDRAGLTPADLLDFRAEPGLFAGLAGWTPRETLLSGAGPTQVVSAAAVTEGMFARVLRVQPGLGRTFLPEEHRPGAVPVVVLDHAFWADRLSADPGVLGRSISLDGEPHTIVGVMPAGFRAPFAPAARLWTPARPVVERCRWCASLEAIGRLAPGTTTAVALERSDAVLQRLAEAYPDTDAGVRLVIEPLGIERMRLRGSFRLLFLATGVVLLIACANVAHLLLVRGGERRAELQVRTAVGAEREHLLRHLVSEALALAAAGSALALLVGAWGIDGLARLAPDEALLTEGIHLDPRLFGFNAVLALVAMLGFGVLPALASARIPGGAPSRHPRVGATAAERGRGSALASSALLVAQVALATTLTTGSVVASRGLHDLRTADLGFDAAGVLAVELTPAGGEHAQPENALMLRAYVDRLSELPGVLSVGATSELPLERSGLDVVFHVGRRRGEVAGPLRAALRLVQGGYAYTVGQRVLEGRALQLGDDEALPEPIVVNESFARAYLGYPRRDALEARIALERDGVGWRPVVGVVADVRSHALAEEPAIYAPHGVRPVGAMTVVLSGDGDAEQLATSAREILAAMAPDVAARRVAPLEELFDAELGAERFAAALLAAFAGLALTLSGVGLYAVVAGEWRSRRAETGIRIALGAQSEDVRRIVVAPGLRITLLGVVIGGTGAAWVGGAFGDLLPPASAVDPLALALAGCALLGVAWIAALIPARRSARLDPVALLREE